MEKRNKNASRCEIKRYEMKNLSFKLENTELVKDNEYFYGVDVDLEIKVKDKETGLEVDTLYMRHRYSGVDLSEEYDYCFESFCEEHELDGDELDWDKDNLPDDLKGELDEYCDEYIDGYMEGYLDALFEDYDINEDEELMEEIEKEIEPRRDWSILRGPVFINGYRYYIIDGEDVEIIEGEMEYSGIVFNDVDDLKKVYNMEIEDRMFSYKDKVFFTVDYDGNLNVWKRKEGTGHVITADEIENEKWWNGNGPFGEGMIGKTIYDYENVA